MVNYSYLEKQLKEQNWQKADEETATLMLIVANRVQEGWIDLESINNFPCADLQTINQLWVKYSNKRFGFSLQKRIYQSLGGTEEYDEKIWKAFGDRVGWRKEGEWLYYGYYNFNLEAPEAHLPLKVHGSHLIHFLDFSLSLRKSFVCSLFSRVQTCRI